MMGNDTSSILIPELIDSEVGTCVLNISDAGGLSSTLSVNPYFANYWISGSLYRFNVKQKKKYTTTTLEKSLDETVGKCDYLKIDTQGTELKILKGNGYDRTMSLELFNEALWEQNPLEVITTGLERMKSLWANA